MKNLSLKARAIILCVLTLVAFAGVITVRVFIMSNDMNETVKNVFYIALLVYLVIYFILTIVLWRCPECGKYLGKVNFSIVKCPHCGSIIVPDADEIPTKKGTGKKTKPGSGKNSR